MSHPNVRKTNTRTTTTVASPVATAKKYKAPIVITEDEFDATYSLRRNHLNPDAAWDGCLFDTHGAEGDFVRSQDPRKIWTMVDGCDGRSIVLSGYHWVNRIAYLISTTAVPDGVSIEVELQ